jgi:hypothetical protein
MSEDCQLPILPIGQLAVNPTLHGLIEIQGKT